MKDFYLTPRGDLSISNINTDYKKLEINFITSFSNALCLNFFIDDVKQSKLSPSSLRINFDIEKPNYDKEMRVISGEESMEQAIKIRLLTALGSLRGNVDIGSTLEELIHELVDSKSLVGSLKSCIANAISDIIPNPVISIEQPKTKYINYSTGFRVVIINGDKQYSINL